MSDSRCSESGPRISQPMKTTSLEEVRAACLALLSGRESHPAAMAARLVSPADVKRAKAMLASLNEIRSRNGALGE